MDHLELLLTAGGGAFSSRQAARLGVSADQLAHWCRSGDVVRVRRAAFVDRATYARAGPDDRYRLRVRAVMAGRSAQDLASHHAALALRGLPLWQLDLARSTSPRRSAATSSGPGCGSTRRPDCRAIRRLFH
ncbi:MAG TPA: type IV toxin-antitoxin system AbiEi family antitoxin domain-containing protein [Lapillicoccus sp.]|nr:type IV toxin-antitoxin system AbiEi family antitoxin domain-containing protein [Lapillicoccus sp.]